MTSVNIFVQLFRPKADLVKSFFTFIGILVVLNILHLYLFENGNILFNKRSRTNDYVQSRTKLIDKHMLSLPENTIKPVILMWSRYYGYNVQYVQNQFNRSVNPEFPHCCEEADVTYDRFRLQEADAVVMHHSFDNLSLKNLPPTRTPDQLWVLYGKESACRTPSLKPFNGLFNITMTYRHDSDIYSPYGYTTELGNKALHDNEDIIINNVTLDKWIKGKSELLAAVISNCHTQSKRENATALLGNDIDVYGKCGTRVCPRNANAKQCDENQIFRNLARKYQFYFAAENSFSQDYISEKFWRALEIGVVPVVYGGGNYSVVAPPGSYVDSRDFESPAELVKFFKKVGRSKRDYKKFFEWRRKYRVHNTNGWHGWCDLCKYVAKYVNSNEKMISRKIYDELSTWWETKPRVNGKAAEKACWEPFWKF